MGGDPWKALRRALDRLRSRLRAEPLALGLILVAGLALRVARLGEIPPGLYCDEVAIALNAESIGRTGRDLSGRRFPLYIEEESFEHLGGTQVVYQPVYTYAAVPWV